MVLTMKLTTFAWNVWDGRRDPKVCNISLSGASANARPGFRQMAVRKICPRISVIARVPRLRVRFFSIWPFS